MFTEKNNVQYMNVKIYGKATFKFEWKYSWLFLRNGSAQLQKRASIFVLLADFDYGLTKSILQFLCEIFYNGIVFRHVIFIKKSTIFESTIHLTVHCTQPIIQVSISVFSRY